MSPKFLNLKSWPFKTLTVKEEVLLCQVVGTDIVYKIITHIHCLRLATFLIIIDRTSVVQNLFCKVTCIVSIG